MINTSILSFLFLPPRVSPPPTGRELGHPEQSIVGAAVAVRGGELIGRHQESEAAAAASTEGENTAESLKQEERRRRQRNKENKQISK